MKILVVGGTGTIGSAVVDALADQHEVTVAGHTSGDVQVDLADPDSIDRLYETVGAQDAVLSCAGEAVFGALDRLDDDDLARSVSTNLMGQVNLVRRGLDAVRDEGVCTLTGGVLSEDPMPGSAAISMVNAGLEGFVRAAALEMPRDIRINVVSPPWVEETLEAMGEDFEPSLPASAVARSYRKSVEGTMTGATIDARTVA
jgi:NAD(P)-dependent dehydrogenase (short-subunit alcohol dehydrogenase family)